MDEATPSRLLCKQTYVRIDNMLVPPLSIVCIIIRACDNEPIVRHFISLLIIHTTAYIAFYIHISV